MKEKLLSLTKKKSTAVIAVCTLFALVLIFLPAGGEKEKNVQASTHIEVESYTEMLEEKIGELCSAVEGVVSPRVLVTLESGTELVYADNKTGTSSGDGDVSYTSDYLIFDRGDGSEPLLVREICPRVRGVAVVVRGGDSPAMQKKLTELLSASLGIPTSRIMVTG